MDVVAPSCHSIRWRNMCHAMIVWNVPWFMKRSWFARHWLICMQNMGHFMLEVCLMKLKHQHIPAWNALIARYAQVRMIAESSIYKTVEDNIEWDVGTFAVAHNAGNHLDLVEQGRCAHAVVYSHSRALNLHCWSFRSSRNFWHGSTDDQGRNTHLFLFRNGSITTTVHVVKIACGVRQEEC